MKYEARVENRRLIFRTDQIEDLFFHDLEGKDVIIQDDDPTTYELRKFFEGAVTPYVFYQHPEAGWQNFKECREALKLEFNFGFTRNIHGDIVTVPLSTVMSKRKFNKMLKNIEQWCEENGYIFPSSEQFWEWKKLKPRQGAIYPPLKDMILNYYKVKGMKVPATLTKQMAL